ncbi:hypothetical protein ALP8811_03037 [Aliiroseovarius pelagivivens]|uniref:Uncharacterized protein n=1 Tax=Aliiroseovarius pelagivivens TaxID=1639690 RepID=A0A2R8ASS9_9RHOB|nr:hypothetical protein [Aliiroseovarius pelagivivens]SPF79103.1 hypothetical protein ALP8811_03037 [Aliiroseovarius pelagivivens]
MKLTFAGGIALAYFATSNSIFFGARRMPSYPGLRAWHLEQHNVSYIFEPICVGELLFGRFSALHRHKD